jgi:hypothetical protein
VGGVKGACAAERGAVDNGAPHNEKGTMEYYLRKVGHVA